MIFYKQKYCTICGRGFKIGQDTDVVKNKNEYQHESCFNKLSDKKYLDSLFKTKSA